MYGRSKKQSSRILENGATPIARFRLEHHDLPSLENVFLGDAFPHELDTSPLCTRVHVARAKTRSCSSPRCDELGCSARYSAFLLSRPFQYLTVRPRGRPFSTCFLLPPSSSLLSVRRPPYTRSYAIHPLSVPPPLFVPPLPRRVPSPCCAPGCTSTPVETTERHKQPI